MLGGKGWMDSYFTCKLTIGTFPLKSQVVIPKFLALTYCPSAYPSSHSQSSQFRPSSMTSVTQAPGYFYFLKEVFFSSLLLEVADEACLL